MKIQLTLILALVLSPLAAPAAENPPSPKPVPEIELGAPFCDNAILQRETAAPVWGWSKPGNTVTVEFAGQKESAKAGEDGKWMLKLKPLKASAEPAEMLVSDSEGKKVVLKNILVGEVWMASGQSNMQWKASQCDVVQILKGIAERVKEGKEKPPVIREFEETSVYSALHPVEHATGAWKDGDMENYSAIATAFAYDLYKELGVPIGILNCSFSMTSVRAWTPRCGFKDGKDEQTQAIYKSLIETDPSTPEHKAAWAKFYQDSEDTLARNAELVKAGKPAEPISTKTPGNMEGNRDATWMFNGRMNPVVPYAIRGAIWNQCYSSMFEGVHYYHRMHSLIRGWREVWGQGDFPVYFHQLYAPGANDGLTLNDMGEMRLGFWLARDIPNTGMASQIDITGRIHYSDKAVPGKRLALHALKNQYGKNIVADGPMFKSYEVKGDKLVVILDHADGGLLVGQMTPDKTLDGPAVIGNGEDKVTLFYLADKDRVWHRAKLKIAGEKLELTAAGVTEPHGVAYACNGVGGLPNIYNKAMLPLSPFIYYDNKLVASKALNAELQAWPDAPIKVEGVKIDPSTVGKQYEYRKMPLLSQQFRDNAVLQADMPVTFWGSTIHPFGYEEKGKAEIKFSFAGIEKTIPVTPGMKEWQVTVPPMQAGTEPKTLKVTFTIDGELVHERVCTNMIVGDVWYVAAPPMAAVAEANAPANDSVRVMTRKASRDRSPSPARYSVASSTTLDSGYASRWEPAKGSLAGMLGQRIAAKTGRPVGIIFMQSGSGKDLAEPELKNWIDAESLVKAPSLMEDHKDLAAAQPGNPVYDADVRRYLADWKKYWSDYIPKLIAEKRVPDGIAWGTYPAFGRVITTTAGQSYNVLTCPFWPGSYKGVVFLTGEGMFTKDQGANFGEQFTILANSWKEKFACPDPRFFYTIPNKTLAPKLTTPAGIKGASTAIEIDGWLNAKPGDKDAIASANTRIAALIERIIQAAYP
jgi:sialate O-acetylesterase